MKEKKELKLKQDKNNRKKYSSVKNNLIQHRFNRKESIELLKNIPIGQLMNMAYKIRCDRFSGNYVTFVFDTNPNYTNICVSKCSFCAFYRSVGDKDAYMLTPDQIATKIKYAESLGATTVLLQGGHNPNISLNDWLTYINIIKSISPNIHIHPFSPTEYVFMAQKEDISINELLNKIWDSGIKTIPGGGAEILNDNIRNVIASKKATSEQWLNTCRIAHEIGFKSTATMMFGHIETDEDIVDHLFKLRDLQDLTGGFTSFIPWSFKPENTLLSKKVLSNVHPTKYIRIIAASRLILDNFQHIQSSWFSESIDAGQLGLLAGADDFGGILVEENVHKEANHTRTINVENIISIIKNSGFIPAQRDSNYNIIKIFK